MCYVLCGSGILTRQDEMQAVCAGEAVLIPSNVAHSMANENEEVLEYGIAQFVDDEGSSPGPAMRKEGRP
jgi:mannose-6-phosphate isomerase-like protein (cupin superfamily)